ncbi:MAG: hypothetical protein II704_06770 [Erysipelotrichaceae bacterium]|nr:hypothetical protein [Erysipelotrichaceae bacterium]
MNMENIKLKLQIFLKKLSIWTVILWLVGWAVAYLVVLPPINPQSLEFWAFFLPALIIPLLVIFQALAFKGGFKKGKSLWPIIVAIIGAAVFFGGMLIASPVFSAKSYASRIAITNASFETDVREVDFSNLPLLDKDSSRKVGDRVVGQIPELVSQFNVSDEYSLINYHGQIIRVTPLEHNGLYKYFSNSEGTYGYVTVDTTTGEAKLVKTSSPIKYLPSAYYFHNLTRHVQIHYPFDILGDASFELDEDGNPYWVIQSIGYGWVNLKPRVKGVIVVDAMSGRMNKYKTGEVPAWVDNVYDANLVIEEINSWGLYQGGYMNSKFAQKNVIQTTTGYTYLTQDDDVYMYTGITSVAFDESNIGFVYVNLRTHEAQYFAVPGAEEYSAMDSAIGSVQEKNYTSTFPLLINLKGRPTYLLSLKDSGGLVKMYAFVDVRDYQKVYVSDASYGIEYAAANYLKMINGDDVPPVPSSDQHGVITVSDLTSVVINGNTVYYLLAEDGGKYELYVTVDVSTVPFIKKGDRLEVSYYSEEGLNRITEVKILEPEINENNAEQGE